MKTLTLRTPEDVISAVPHLIGFHPAESLVLIVPGSRRTAARIDMPASPADRREVVAALAPMFEESRPVLALTYTLDDEAADALVAMVNEHADVLSHIRVHADTYRADDKDEQPLADSMGVEAEMVFNGSNPAPSREALLLPTVTSLPLVRAVSSGNHDPDQAEEEAWVVARLSDPDTGHDRLTDTELARVVIGCERFGNRFRDVIHTTIDKTRAQRDQWRDAAERVGNICTAVTVTYAMTAWMAGDGAQAWVALEAVNDAPGHRNKTMASLIGEALSAGMDPLDFTPVTLAELDAAEQVSS